MTKFIKFIALATVYYGLCIAVFSIVSYVLYLRPDIKSSLTDDDYYQWNFTLAIFLYQTMLITLFLTPILWLLAKFILDKTLYIIRFLSGHVNKKLTKKK